MKDSFPAWIFKESAKGFAAHVVWFMAFLLCHYLAHGLFPDWWHGFDQ